MLINFNYFTCRHSLVLIQSATMSKEKTVSVHVPSEKSFLWPLQIYGSTVLGVLKSEM